MPQRILLLLAIAVILYKRQYIQDTFNEIFDGLAKDIEQLLMKRFNHKKNDDDDAKDNANKGNTSRPAGVPAQKIADLLPSVTSRLGRDQILSFEDKVATQSSHLFFVPGSEQKKSKDARLKLGTLILDMQRDSNLKALQPGRHGL